MGKRKRIRKGDKDATVANPFEENSLVYYLVSRFIVMLLIVMACETAVVWLESSLFLPALEPFFTNYVSESLQTASVGALLERLFSLFSTAHQAGGFQLVSLARQSFVILLIVAMLLLLMAPLLIGALCFALVIVRKMRALQQIREEEVAHANRQRNRFITDVAHDLRTPIMAISGMSHALSDGLVEDPAMRDEYLRSICDKTDKMGELVSSVFDYAKLGSEGFALQREKLNLPELLLREAATAYTDAEEAGIELTVHVPEDRCMVEADPVQLGRVMANLLSNAIRHNEAGVEVALMTVRQAGMVYIAVADTGLPLTEDPDDLFQPFTRGDAARSARGGSGLGLSICKRVADMHGFGLTLVQPYGRFPKAFVLQCPVED